MGKKSDWERTAKKLAKIYGNPAATPQPNPEPVRQTDAERAASEQNYNKMQANWWNKLFKSEDN